MVSWRVVSCSVAYLVLCSIGGAPLTGQTAAVSGNPKHRGGPDAGKHRPIVATRLQAISTESGPSQLLGISCLSHCLYCWLGSPFEQDCLSEWLTDGECDCGCQFSDNADCGSSCSCPAACDWCWCNTTAQGACPAGWYGDGECDCGCSPADPDCPSTTLTGACCFANGACSVTTSAVCSSQGGAYRGNNVTCAQANCAADSGACCAAHGDCGAASPAGCAQFGGAYQGNGTLCSQIDCRARCAAICDYCWVDTPLDGNCDPLWEGDGQCDCGCEFNDPDCGPEGACCAPANGICAPLTETTCRFYAAGIFHGVDVACTQVDCDRCDPSCQWCWTDTIGEHVCLPEWAGDGECDCGCQFADPDCASDVCGNLVCEETAATCSEDCKDLRAVADFQNCFDPGHVAPLACVGHLFAPPTGIGLEDFAAFVGFLYGP